MLADEDGSREGHAEVPAVKGYLYQCTVGDAHAEDLRKGFHHRVCDIVGESPKGEAESDEDKRQEKAHTVLRYQRLLLFHMLFDNV